MIVVSGGVDVADTLGDNHLFQEIFSELVSSVLLSPMHETLFRWWQLLSAKQKVREILEFFFDI